MKLPWFRVYSSILDDRKIRRVSKKTGQPKAMILGVWITLLALANDSPERGKLMIADSLWLDLEEIQEETGVVTETLHKIIETFHLLDMINGNTGRIEIINWNKRQFQSDNSTERVRKHREQKKQQDETLQKRSGNAPDTDTDTDTDNIKVISDLIIDGWIEKLPGKPKPRNTSKLKDKLKARLKDEKWSDTFFNALTKASNSNHLKTSSWFDIHFLLRNEENVYKVSSGYYDSWDDKSQKEKQYDPEQYRRGGDGELMYGR